MAQVDVVRWIKVFAVRQCFDCGMLWGSSFKSKSISKQIRLSSPKSANHCVVGVEWGKHLKFAPTG